MSTSAQEAGRAVLIGASASGLQSLMEICEALPSDFPAPVLVVLHIGSHSSRLPNMLRERTVLDARFAIDGEPVIPGTIYVAPPDHHLLLTPQTLHLSRSVKEHWTRPAIDPTFRSAASHWNERAIGVLLAGLLNDGTAGLKAIKSHGGIAIVQDPATTGESAMLQSALDHVAVDHCLAPSDIVTCLQHIVRTAPAAVRAPARSATPPEAATYGGMRDGAEHVATASMQSLMDRESLLRRLAAVARSSGREREALAGERCADGIHARRMRLVRTARQE